MSHITRVTSGVPPTVRELARTLNAYPGSIVERIGRLQRAGYLEHDPRMSRTLRIIAIPLIVQDERGVRVADWIPRADPDRWSVPEDPERLVQKSDV